MKNNIFKGIFFLLISLLGIISCSDRETIQVENQSAPITADLSSKNVVLNKFFPNASALTVTWNSATYSVPVEINYKIESSGTSDFKKAYLLGTVNNSQRGVTYTADQINNATADAGLKSNVPSKLYIRVTSYLSGSTPSLLAVSNVTSVTVTPYPIPKVLYLMGSATAAGQNNNNNNQVIFRDPANVNAFYFTGYFKAGTFKLIEKLGSDTPQWGLNSSGAVVSYDGSGTTINGFNIPTSGYYDFKIDIDAQTYSLTPNTTVTATSKYSSIGLIGSATANAWNSDTVMAQSTFDPHLWSIVGKVDSSGKVTGGVELSVNEAKFRADGKWDMNWGGSTPISGQAIQNGPNIPVTLQGTYSVYFNDIDGRYFIIKL